MSQLHRVIAMDIRTGRPACPPYAANAIRFEVFEFWSSDMLKLFRESGLPRRTPPVLPDCASTDSLEAPRISSPLRSVSYALRRSNSQDVITLEASFAADVRNVFWLDGSTLIGKQSPMEGSMAWRPSREGIHLLRVIDDHGRTAERSVQMHFIR